MKEKDITGELTIIISNIFFALTAILVKFVPNKFDGYFISFIRFIIGLILGICFILVTKNEFKIYKKWMWVLRGLLGAGSMILYFVAIQLTSSGRATLLTITFPIFVAIFGVFIFKDKLYLNNIISIFLCIFGIIFVFYDGSNYSLFGDTLAIVASIMAGFSVHFLKKLREHNNATIVYLAVCFFGLLLTSFSVKNNVLKLDISLLFLMILIGITAFLAQLFMTYGFKYVSTTRGSIMTFSKIPITIVLSYFIGEHISLMFIIGTILIIIGLIINRK